MGLKGGGEPIEAETVDTKIRGAYSVGTIAVVIREAVPLHSKGRTVREEDRQTLKHRQR